MRIIFIVDERVGYAALEKIFKMKFIDVAAVFTVSDILKNRIADYKDFEELSRSNKIGIRNFQYINTTNNEACIEEIESINPDFIFVISWSFKIPKKITDNYKVIGIHYSLLPERRGGAPLNWAIIQGETETGITMYYMNEYMDCGNIIDQIKFPIKKTDTPKELLDKIELLVPIMIEKNIEYIRGGGLGLPQNTENNSIFMYAQRKPEDSNMELFVGTLEEMYNFIRALDSPYPNAFLKLNNGKKIFLSNAILEDGKLTVKGIIK